MRRKKGGYCKVHLSSYQLNTIDKKSRLKCKFENDKEFLNVCLSTSCIEAYSGKTNKWSRQDIRFLLSSSVVHIMHKRNSLCGILKRKLSRNINLCSLSILCSLISSKTIYSYWLSNNQFSLIVRQTLLKLNLQRCFRVILQMNK